MNSKALHSLEYDKIIEQLESRATSDAGRTLCRKLMPSADIKEINRLQQETADALVRILHKGSISFGGGGQLSDVTGRLKIGASLNMAELLRIGKLLGITSRVKAYGARERDDVKPDSIEHLFSGLCPVPSLAKNIERCIISESEVSDDASPSLRSLRRNIASCEDKIHSQLASFINGSGRTYLQDAVVTMRNGRYCVPVKLEYKSQVPGMVHDISSSGSTIFIEPMSVVSLNNNIREIERKIELEIQTILAELSQEAAEHLEEIGLNYELLSELDFIFARGLLALDMNASRPKINENGIIDLKKARHPLIDKKDVVPIDIRLGEDFTLLVITGPNTGGKTVSLKTTGLLTLMAQAGLHIPVAEYSTVSVFEEVYADIGDEQSIEQSLSTFSAHMTNIVSFIERANERSLVLFDELGAGTDPTEGAALAISILSHLKDLNVRAMATTHYAELKMFALSAQNVENASCEFDIKTLRPTYNLLIGVPGKSNAFAISARLGLPDYIIDGAKRQISSKDETFEEMMTSLEEKRINIENDRIQIEKERLETEKVSKKLKERYERLEEQRNKILHKANEEAANILKEAKGVADETIRAFNRAGKDTLTARELEKEREKLRKNLEKAQSAVAIKKETAPAKKLKASDIHIGDMVKVLSLNLKGTVSTRPDSKNKLYVQLGIMRTRVSLDDLELVDEDVITAPGLKRKTSGSVKISKSATLSPEINLLGRTVDEAIAELDKYLDDAYLSHMPSVRVVHGKGTGALRNGIHRYLKRLKYVKSFRLGEFGEGDAGVTIVEFK